jgi:hypothetical protein
VAFESAEHSRLVVSTRHQRARGSYGLCRFAASNLRRALNVDIGLDLANFIFPVGGTFPLLEKLTVSVHRTDLLYSFATRRNCTKYRFPYITDPGPMAPANHISVR